MYNTILRRILSNMIIFKKCQKIGVEYLLNPMTKELHYVSSDFWGSHNLHRAHLEDFIGLINIRGLIKIHNLPEGIKILIYDLFTGVLKEKYILNKCEYCKRTQESIY